METDLSSGSRIQFECVPDLEIASYLRNTYGPFLQGKVIGRSNATCDICYRKVNKVVAIPFKEGVGKEIACCMGACLDILVSNPDAIRASAAVITEPLSEGLWRCTPSDIFTTTNDPADTIKQAKSYLKAGFGRRWNVIPSILKQFEQGKDLTTKQLSVLEKFNHSCKREV